MLTATEIAFAQDSEPRLATPVEPVEAIIRELETHNLVAITIPDYQEVHEVLHSLLSTPEFPSVVDDVVVEFGASRYQDVIDTFTSGGQVPYEDLEKAWQQTTQPHHVSDPPAYEAFFRAVRELNSSLPQEQQLRIVAAEPPIDWDLIEDGEDLLPWLQERFPYEAEVVEREVLDKGRKALLLSGALHFANGTPLLNTIEAHGSTIYKIWMTPGEKLAALQPDIETWPQPSLTRIQNTLLGAADIVDHYDLNLFPPGPLEDQYDAILYLGREADLTELRIAPELCSDQEYLEMRLRRLRIADEIGNNDFSEHFFESCDGILDQQ